MVKYYLRKFWEFLKEGSLYILFIITLVLRIIFDPNSDPFVTFLFFYAFNILISSSMIILLLHNRYKKEKEFLKNKSEIFLLLDSIERNGTFENYVAAHQIVINQWVINKFKSLCTSCNTFFETEITIDFIIGNKKFILTEFFKKNPKYKFEINLYFKRMIKELNNNVFMEDLYISYKENTLLNHKTPLLQFILSLTVIIFYIDLFKKTVTQNGLLFVLVITLFQLGIYYLFAFSGYISYVKGLYIDYSIFYLERIDKIKSNL